MSTMTAKGGEMRIPKWVKIETGHHDDESCEVCLEELKSLLLIARERAPMLSDKTDRPKGVHPIIYQLGQEANDTERDPKKRRKLVATVGRQAGTYPVDTFALAAFVCRWAKAQLPDSADGRVGVMLDAAAAVLLDPSEENAAAAKAAVYTARAADAYSSAAYAAANAAAYAAAHAAYAAANAATYAAADAAYAAANAADAAAYAADADAAIANAVCAAVGAANAAAYAAAYAADAANANAVCAAVGAAADACADTYRRLLEAVLDEFDRLTGRTEHWEPTKTEWDRVRAILVPG